MREPAPPPGDSPWLPRDQGPRAPGRPPDDWQPPATDTVPDATVGPTPARGLPVLPPRAGRVPRRVALPAWLVALAALALVGAVVLTLVLVVRDGGAAAGDGGGPRPGATVRALDDPFVLSGVRWAVFADPQQPWTAFASLTSAGPGRRWLLVTVRVHNLVGPPFSPSTRGYVVVDDAGAVVRPDRNHGTPAQAADTVSRDSYGTVHLAFRVPTRSSPLRLRFRAGPGAARIVEVPLGRA